MLKELSPEALSSLRDVLQQPLKAIAAARGAMEAYSAPLLTWLQAAVEREFDIRSGRDRAPLLAPVLAGLELLRARAFALNLALSFSADFVGVSSAENGVGPELAAHYARIAQEIEPVMVAVAEGLATMQALETSTVTH